MGELDRTLFLLVYRAQPNAVWLAFMMFLSFFGGGNALFAIVPFLGWTKTRRAVARLLVAIALTAVVVYSVKHVVGRARPYSCVDGVCVLGYGHPVDPSFPSGHSAGAFCFAAFFADRKRPWLTLGLGLTAFAIGLSRVVLGVHFPGDVTAGATIGATIGALTSRFFAARDAKRVTLAATKDAAARDSNG